MQDVVPDRYPTQQLHLGLFTSHEISAWEQEQTRKNSRREIHGETKARRRFWFQEDKASRSLFDAMDAAVLDPPLGGPQEGNELNCAVDPLGESTDDREQLISPAGEEKLPWSDEAVAQLHEAVLHHSLKALQAKGNGVEKREVLEWIFAPQPMVVALEGVDGQRSEAVLPQHLTPFSFERCCRMCGYSHERLMDGLMPIVRLMGFGNIFSEIPNGNNTNSVLTEIQNP